MECDKNLVAKALCIATILAGREVEDMEYTKRDDNEEFVTITYRNGSTKDVCVTASSGVALMREVLEQVH